MSVCCYNQNKQENEVKKLFVQITSNIHVIVYKKNTYNNSFFK